MKLVLILTSCLLFGSMSLFAQEVKKDTLTDEQKKEMVQTIANMLAAGGGNEQDQQTTDSIRNALSKYQPGTLAPDFQYKDVNGKVVSLKQLRGKYVYIDVWATWCAPCCKEIPFLQKLEEKMHGKKIAFVSISVDQNRKSWEKMVKEKNMGGIQLQANIDDQFIKELSVDEIPRFILLDKKGKVVKAFMSRPSNPETEKALRALKGI